MRKFIDLHLKPEAGSAEEMLKLASRLGYGGVGLIHNGTATADGAPLDIVSRIDLMPRNANDLTATLRRIRRRYEIVAVECRSKNVARQAAKDNRVDVLNFPGSVSERRRVRFDRQEASLASDANCAYEINVSDLMGAGPLVLSKLLSIIREETENAERHGVPVVVSSGAQEPLAMRDPRSLAAVLSLLDINEEQSLDTVSTNPWDMVARNREKLGPGFVMPGVRRI